MHIAIGIGPKPSFSPVISRAVSMPNGKIPKRNSNFFSSQPLPSSYLLIPHSAHPVLSTGIAPVPPPQLPTDEPLQGGVAFVHQSTTAIPAESQRIPELQRLPVVEYVAFAVVCGRAAWWLISELWTAFNRQSLVCVHESFAYGKLTGYWYFQVDADKRARHWGVAWQKQRLAFLYETGESVAYGVRAQIGAVVAHSNYDRCRLIRTYNKKKSYTACPVTLVAKRNFRL